MTPIHIAQALSRNKFSPLSSMHSLRILSKMTYDKLIIACKSNHIEFVPYLDMVRHAALVVKALNTAQICHWIFHYQEDLCFNLEESLS